MTARSHCERSVTMTLYLSLAVVVVFLTAGARAGGNEQASATAALPTWQPGTSHRLESLRVSLSKPVVVARSKDYLWFPGLYRRENGDLLALASTNPDVYQDDLTCLASWSNDGGMSWSPPFRAKYGDVFVSRSSGDAICLPYNLFHRKEGLGNAYLLLPRGSQEPQLKREGLVVRGFPRPDQRNSKNPDASGFVFNGDVISRKDGEHLTTLYGNFEGEKRCALLAARSPDGLRWQIASTIADSNCPLFGEDGPSEASMCRLKDGRIMAVFRLAGYTAYGQAFSDDEGQTWTVPVKMKGPFSVQPSLVTLPSGVVVLSGGRPGLFMWFNSADDGLSWEAVDLRAAHNATQPQDYIHESDNITESTPGHHYRHETTSYTQIVAVDDSHLLVIYDRGPRGGEKIDEIAPETNSLWVMRISVTNLKP